MKRLLARFPVIICLLAVQVTLSRDACYGQYKKPLTYILISDIPYKPNDTLVADFYLPVNYKNQRNPVLIFIDGVGSDFRKWDHYISWAKFAASEGFVSVVYSSRENYASESFQSLVDFLFDISDTYFTDLKRISTYAGSGNVMHGLPLANGDTRIKSAIMYYGTAKMESFRPDMPVLLVRAGLDNVELNKKLDSLAFKALSANAPYTITNFNTALHGFEDFKDEEISLPFIKLSLDFLKNNMRVQARENLSAHLQEVVAMGELYQANWKAAVKTYTYILENNPGNNEAERQLGNICIELNEYDKALGYYDSALAHGNWRKGEIALKKLYVYVKLKNVDAAVTEMRTLRKIGWFNEADYTGKNEYINIVRSEAYKKFITEKI